MGGRVFEIAALFFALGALITILLGPLWVGNQILLCVFVFFLVVSHWRWRRRALRWDWERWLRRNGVHRPRRGRVSAGVVIPPDDDVL